MPSRLSNREKEVLALIAQGKRNADIAQILEISTSTVQNHIRNLLRKLKVCNRSEAACKYWEELLHQQKKVDFNYCVYCGGLLH